MLTIHAINAGQDVEYNFRWRLGRVNHAYLVLAVVIEDRLRFLLVSFQAPLNYLLIGVVQAVVFQRALFPSSTRISMSGLNLCASTAAAITSFQSSTVISSGTSWPLLE